MSASRTVPGRRYPAGDPRTDSRDHAHHGRAEHGGLAVGHVHDRAGDRTRRSTSFYRARSPRRPWLGARVRAPRLRARADPGRRARVDELGRRHRRGVLNAVRHRQDHLRRARHRRGPARHRRRCVRLDRPVVPIGAAAAGARRCRARSESRRIEHRCTGPSGLTILYLSRPSPLGRFNGGWQ